MGILTSAVLRKLIHFRNPLLPSRSKLASIMEYNVTDIHITKFTPLLLRFSHRRLRACIRRPHYITSYIVPVYEPSESMIFCIALLLPSSSSILCVNSHNFGYFSFVRPARSLAANKGKLMIISAPVSLSPQRNCPRYGDVASWLSRNSKCVLKLGWRNRDSIRPAILFVIGRIKNGTGAFLISALR